jgi:hypothetical protein
LHSRNLLAKQSRERVIAPTSYSATFSNFSSPDGSMFCVDPRVRIRAQHMPTNREGDLLGEIRITARLATPYGLRLSIRAPGVDSVKYPCMGAKSILFSSGRDSRAPLMPMSSYSAVTLKLEEQHTRGVWKAASRDSGAKRETRGKSPMWRLNPQFFFVSISSSWAVYRLAWARKSPPQTALQDFDHLFRYSADDRAAPDRRLPVGTHRGSAPLRPARSSPEYFRRFQSFYLNCPSIICYDPES